MENKTKSLDPTLKNHFRGHKGAITQISFGPDSSQIATSSTDSSVIIWNLNKNHRTIKFNMHSGPVNSVCWSPKRDLIASVSSDRTIKIWEPKLRGNCGEIIAHTSSISSVDFSPDGCKLLTSSYDKTIKLWKIGNQKHFAIYNESTNWIRCARFDPEGKLFASCGDDKIVRIYDIASGKCVKKFKDSRDSAGEELDWHPTSQYVVVATANKCIRMYDLTANKLVQVYEGFSDKVNSVSFHPFGLHIMSGSEDGTAPISDITLGVQMCTIKPHNGSVKAVKCSNDGKYFATGGADAQLMIFELDISDNSEETHSIRRRQDFEDNCCGSSEGTNDTKVVH